QQDPTRHGLTALPRGLVSSSRGNHPTTACPPLACAGEPLVAGRTPPLPPAPDMGPHAVVQWAGLCRELVPTRPARHIKDPNIPPGQQRQGPLDMLAVIELRTPGL